MQATTLSYQATRNFAKEQDAIDPLKDFREKFYLPQHEGKDCLYFCGNSLGLQPKNVQGIVLQELEDWKNLGVEGHFKGKDPWMPYHRPLTEKIARVVGALPHEVVAMNTLTVNLHLMMVSFYQPKDSRYKIIMEADAFPSDHYAIASQVKFHGYDPEDAVIQLKPREGEHALRTEDILQEIDKAGNSLALVLLGGVNYYTGQYFNLKEITQKAHEVGAYAGYDLAHAAGNIRLELHDSGADFGVWCTYKYLNSGPGGISGAFIHERHAKNVDLPRFAGWWGHQEDVRFLMDKTFVPMEGAEGWQLSNAPILLMAAHKASLEVFDEAGMERLEEKSRRLTGYLEYLVGEFNQAQDNVQIHIITPSNPKERGCQLSLVTSKDGKKIHQYLSDHGVISDWREPDVIRVAPVPLYNSFEDVYGLYELLLQAVS